MVTKLPTFSQYMELENCPISWKEWKSKILQPPDITYNQFLKLIVKKCIENLPKSKDADLSNV